VGSGLIAAAPLFAAHFIFIREMRYMLLAWFCSFVSTVLIIFCSLSSLFTKNPWIILAFSVPFDVVGKAVLKHLGHGQQYFTGPHSRISLGMVLGLGFALAHVLTLYFPVIFDQPHGVLFDNDHPAYFPNCLDLAICYNAVSVFHMTLGLIWFRYPNVNIVVMTIIMLIVEYGLSALSQIPLLPVKLGVMLVVAYVPLMFVVLSYRHADYTSIPDEKDHRQ
jgi:hypothetical protein